VPRFDFTSLAQMPWFIVLGMMSGVLGALFLRAVKHADKLYNQVAWPLYLRLASAGLIVGALAIAFPEVLGNGYMAISRMLEGEMRQLTVIPAHALQPELQFLIGLFAAKFLATVITVGSGTVGGVFTPTLFLGAGLGSLFGALLHFSGTPVPTGIYALVGMGSVLAATTHSPLLAILIIFELSLNYSIMPPLMLSCVISTLIARRFYPESIYTEPLRRKGVELARESPHLGAATQLTVADIMRPPVPPLKENTPFREIADRFLTQTYNFLPVIDDKQRLLGMVALHDLKEWLTAGQELSSVIAYDIMRPPPACVTAVQKLTDVLPLLLASEVRNVPVVNNLSDYKLIGTIARSEALGLLSEAISAQSRPTVTH
jgi:CIC family chloride channel protein